MNVLRRLGAALRALWHRDRLEAELDEELRSYLDSAAEAKMAAGMAQADARRAARVDFGSLEALKDGVRDVGWESSIDRVWQDVRYAVRMLRRSPTFALVAIMTLGLGIGATTTIYSIVDTILVQPLPFPDAERLVRVVENVPSRVTGAPPVQRGIPYSDLVEWQSRSRTLTDTFAVAVNYARIVETRDGSARLWSAMVSVDTFAALGAHTGVDAMIPMARLVASSVAGPRFYAVLLGVFGVVAGLLAAIGVYGVLAYAVMQRTQEIGLRMALGAQRAQVLGLVLRQGAALTAAGLALGLVGATAGAGLLRGMLFGIAPLDPWTFIVVFLAFGLVATVASYIPARHATKVDPMVALRSE